MDDARVRAAAFRFLEEQTGIHGDVLPWSVLLQGFTIDGKRVPLINPQGIFKPAVLDEMPLSFNTAPPHPRRPPPYADELGADGRIRYHYRRGGADHPDNEGMRLAMLRRVPLIYLYGTVPGKYLAIWPVYIVDDDRATETFAVQVDDARLVTGEPSAAGDELRRAYTTRIVWQRMHQTSFRDRVLLAYRESCSVCRLRHAELLDAAHILPDKHPEGVPSVSNGLALCKLHHAAFDRHILGIRPDRVIEIRRDILDEVDGPMLQHGLKDMDGHIIHVPRPTELQPREEFLEERYAIFRKAS